MSIGAALRLIREEQHLSQGDVERRSDLMRCYISRVESGKTDPTVDTIKRWAAALGVSAWEVVKRWEEGKNEKL